VGARLYLGAKWGPGFLTGDTAPCSLRRTATGRLLPGSTIAICCWPELQSLLPTSCSGPWTLQRELWATASSFHQPPSTRCSMVSARYVRPSHLRWRWTNHMKLVPKQFAWAGHANWLFSSYTEDVSFLSVLGTLSALEAFFATMHYINWHLHLHSAFLCQYLLGLPGCYLKFSGIYSSACFAILVWSMHRIHPSHFKHLHCVTVSICCSPLHFLTLHLLPGLSTDSLNSSLPFVMCSLQSL